MHRTISSLLFLLAATPAIAADTPDPFGLSLGDSCDQVQSMRAETQGASTITGGPVYQVDVAPINFDGLLALSVVCSEARAVAAVIAHFEKEFGGATFDRLRKMLQDNYTLDRLDEAHVGNQQADFSHNNVRILLEEPHMSRRTSVTYMTDAFDRQFQQYQREEAREKERQEAGQL